MGRSRLPLAFVVAAAAAAVATFVLRPRGLIEPAPVDVQQYFTASQLDRAEDFRSLQRALIVAGIGVQIATLVVLVWRPPRRVLRRLERRPLLVVTSLPIRAWLRQRSLDVGLSTQSWPDWAVDVLKGAAIGAVSAAIGGL